MWPITRRVTGSTWCRSVQFVRCEHSLKTNSHRHARHDKTVLSVSRPLRRCELDSRQLKTVADRKSEDWTRSEQLLSNSHRQPDTTQTRLSHMYDRLLATSHHITTVARTGRRIEQLLLMKVSDRDRNDKVNKVWLWLIYRVSQKVSPLTFCNNNRKSAPI